MAKVTGIVKVYINAQLQRSKEGASLKFGGHERAAVVGHSVYGYAEKPVASEITFTLADMADTDLIAINDTVDATVRFETDTGKVFLITEAWVSEPVELAGGEGDVSVTMMGQPAVEE